MSTRTARAHRLSQRSTTREMDGVARGSTAFVALALGFILTSVTLPPACELLSLTRHDMYHSCTTAIIAVYVCMLLLRRRSMFQGRLVTLISCGAAGQLEAAASSSLDHAGRVSPRVTMGAPVLAL
jgi:hypothetical protein